MKLVELLAVMDEGDGVPIAVPDGLVQLALLSVRERQKVGDTVTPG